MRELAKNSGLGLVYAVCSDKHLVQCKLAFPIDDKDHSHHRAGNCLPVKLFAFLFCIPIILTSCGIQFAELLSSGNCRKPSSVMQRESIKSVEDTISKPPYPGDFKLVTRGSGNNIEELWQSRGEVG